MFLLKTILLVLFLIAWSGLGLYMLVNFQRYFGPHQDDPSETAGACSLNVTHVASVWFGFFALATYFLFS